MTRCHHTFELDPRIRLIRLGIYRASSSPLDAVRNHLKRTYVLRRALRDVEADVVISFQSFLSMQVLLGTRGLGVPVVVSEHLDPLVDPPSRAMRWLRRWVYSLDSHIVVLTERARTYFPPKLRAKTTAIPNPVTPFTNGENDSPEVVLDRPSLIAMGRLHRQKGFDLLLKAFGRLKDRHPIWTLAIIGDGPLRSDLESLRDELGLRERVRLLGAVSNVHSVLNQADLFVLSSRWEGFPLVLMEAIACGLPVISTDCRTGPREIVRDGVDGVLVPPDDVDALSAAMNRLMSDESARKSLASRPADVEERFGVEKVMGKWEELLRTVVLK